jgi:hypothetical protein
LLQAKKIAGGRFCFFQRGVQESTKRQVKVQAYDLVNNKDTIEVLVKASPRRVPPPSFVAECLKEVDDYFKNELTGAVTDHEAAKLVMLDAMNGCAMYGYLRRLSRNNIKSKNKVMGHLKSLVRRKNHAEGDAYKFPDLSESSSSSDGADVDEEGTTAGSGELEASPTPDGVVCDSASGTEDDNAEMSDVAEGSVAPDAKKFGWIGLLDRTDLSALRTFFTEIADADEDDNLQLQVELSEAWGFDEQQFADLAEYFKRPGAANQPYMVDLDGGGEDSEEEVAEASADDEMSRGEKFLKGLDEDKRLDIVKAWVKLSAMAGKAGYPEAFDKFMEKHDLDEDAVQYLSFHVQDLNVQELQPALEEIMGDDGATAEALDAADSDGDGGVADMHRDYPPPPGEHYGGPLVIAAATAALDNALFPKDQLTQKKKAGKGMGKGKSKSKSKGKKAGKVKGTPIRVAGLKAATVKAKGSGKAGYKGVASSSCAAAMAGPSGASASSNAKVLVATVPAAAEVPVAKAPAVPGKDGDTQAD